MSYRYLVWGMMVVFGWFVGTEVSFATAQQLSQGLGPLPIRNFQPVQLLFLHLPFEGAELTSKGHWAFSFGLAESNTINETTKQSEETSLVFDLETSRFTLGAKYGLFDRVRSGDRNAFYPALGRIPGSIYRRSGTSGGEAQ